MKVILIAMIVCFSSLLQAEIKVQVSTDRESALYEVGDEVTFKISVKDGDKTLDWGQVAWNLSMDGYKSISQGNETLGASKVIVVKGTLNQPGFLRLTATFPTPNKKRVKGVGAAGFSPEKLKPSLPAPDDFNKFWVAQKQTLAKFPLSAKLTPAKSPTRLSVVFDVQIPVGTDKKPVSGYFAKPENAKPKSCPAVLWVHGAGVRSSMLTTAIRGANDGFISMDINAHGIPNGKPKEYYANLYKNELKGYNKRPEYFEGMFIRMIRAIDFLTARPEWNGTIMAVVGHSQGGFQALVAGGLDDRVTFIGAGVPAGCDHTGMQASRISGWPKIIPAGASPELIKAARYVDAVNFARQCKTEAILSVGFIDPVCPPTSIYAAYNSLKGKKSILTRPKMSHAAPAEIQALFRKALLKHASISPTPVAK